MRLVNCPCLLLKALVGPSPPPSVVCCPMQIVVAAAARSGSVYAVTAFPVAGGPLIWRRRTSIVISEPEQQGLGGTQGQRL